MVMNSPHSALPHRGTISGLDSLRGLAILMVLIAHSNTDYTPWHGVVRLVLRAATAGALGVHLFYVLSGFLISGILIDSKRSKTYFSTFYVRRALRILPAYTLMIVVLKAAHIISWKFTLACFLYVANMASIVGANTGEYGPFWSLAVEEQFYIVWPLVIRRFSLDGIRRTIYLVCLVSPLIRGLSKLNSLDAYYKAWDNCDYLMYGALIALFLRDGTINSMNIRRLYRFMFGVGSLLCSALVYWRWSGDPLSPAKEAALSAVGILPFTLVAVALVLRAIASNVNRHRTGPLIFLGYISYGLYLVHQLIFELYDKIFAHTPLGGYESSIRVLVLRDTIVISISIGVAYLSRRFFEDPFLRKKAIFAPNSTPELQWIAVPDDLAIGRPALTDRH